MAEAKLVKKFFSWQVRFMVPEAIWYVKRLSANDTLATKAHQAGPYIPSSFLFSVLPELHREDTKNPDTRFNVHIDSHAQSRNVRAVWYNNKLFGGTRNETRLTNFGGKKSPLLRSDSTGALVVLAFADNETDREKKAHVWVCRSKAEEDLLEDRVGPVEPGQWLAYSPVKDIRPPLFTSRPKVGSDCRLAASEIPVAWLDKFPTGSEMIRKTIELCPAVSLNPDERLLQRRDCEFEMFLGLEETVELPAIKEGFVDIERFVLHAQSILQRRKARSGRSLELHLREIFIEEGLQENVDFSHGIETEPGRRPDFLFPSQTLYGNPNHPDHQLRMLAVKTTCRDRWRQILNEAGRITTKHLLTLQEGVSVNQFKEMQDSNVRLVVPASLHGKYPEEIRSSLITLEEFIDEMKLLRESGHDGP